MAEMKEAPDLSGNSVEGKTNTTPEQGAGMINSQTTPHACPRFAWCEQHVGSRTDFAETSHSMTIGDLNGKFGRVTVKAILDEPAADYPAATDFWFGLNDESTPSAQKREIRPADYDLEHVAEMFRQIDDADGYASEFIATFPEMLK